METSIKSILEDNSVFHENFQCQKLVFGDLEVSQPPLTHFERKYKLAGVNLYELIADFGIISPVERAKILQQ